MNLTPYVAALLVTITLVSPAPAQAPTVEPSPVDAAERQVVVATIADLLSARYVFPDVADEAGATLQAQFEAGEFDDVENAEAFATRLTESLQSVTHDKHMRVRVRAPDRVAMQREQPARARARAGARERQRNFGFETVQRLDGNIGYVDMRYFSGSPEGRQTATAAMNFLANVDAIIFDMRQNGGGSPDMIRYISSYLFDEPTHLNSLYWREGDRTDEFWTLDDVPGPRLGDVPCFVLTSDYTFSGAEEFSYNLRTRERATLIGATTGGGANPGGVVPVNDRFGIFIPVGRAINPVTGTNWEGVGVKPHVDVDPDEAYDVALEKARAAAEQRRADVEAAQEATWIAYEKSQRAVREHVEAGRLEDAAKAFASALGPAHAAGLLGEMDINMLGYQHLGRGETAIAIAAFRFNVDAYPESSNVYDSLGEALMEDGDHEQAIRMYRRSLELDPGNENASAMIARMKETHGG